MQHFGEIYTEHFSNVYKYVLSISGDESIAEEITQETFFKAMRNIKQFNGTCKLYVWLCQIAKNYHSCYHITYIIYLRIVKYKQKKGYK